MLGADGKELAMSSYQGVIEVIDVATRTKSGVIDLGEYRRPHGMAVHPVTGQIVVTIENPDGLLLVEVETAIVAQNLWTDDAAHIARSCPARLGPVLRALMEGEE